MRPKDILLRAARASGLLTLIRDSEWRRRRLLIFCWHGVSIRDEHRWNGELYVTADLLRRRLCHLRRHRYAILPLDEACRRLTEGTLPHRSVAITFDDGAIDFERAALPVLQEFDAPATVYLTTYYADTRLPVFDTVLSYVLWRGRSSGGDVAALCGSETPLPVASDRHREAAYTALREWTSARGLDARAKDDFVGQVAETLGVNYEAVRASDVLRLMSPQTVAALPRGLIDVQLHTHRHRAPLERDQFIRELRDNAHSIRAMRGTSQNLSHFCYPSGVYRGQFLSWLREVDVTFATTCVPGIASADDDPLLLPRFIDTCRTSSVTFEAWASGLAAWLPMRREYRLDRRLIAEDEQMARSL